MRFIPFLDKIPKTNRTYLGKSFEQNGSLNIVFTYWGTYNDQHQIQDQYGFYLNPERVTYLCEEEVEEYECECIESKGCDCGQPSCSICG